MGCGALVSLQYAYIPNSYSHPEEVADALRIVGLTEAQLILGVDFSKSNLDNGARSFDGWSLHDVSRKKSKNPYMQCLGLLKEGFKDFEVDQKYPVYGFADTQTGSGYVFSFEPGDKPMDSFEALTERYKEIAREAIFSGPSSLAPIIRQSILKVREAAAYGKPMFHILVVLTDGIVTDRLDTEFAIQEASNYPLSIIAVGLGDGPFSTMIKYDDKLRRRKFDNYNFVDFNRVFALYPFLRKSEAFATDALQEVPAQYKACVTLGYMKDTWEMPETFKLPPKPLGPPDQPNAGDPSDGCIEGWTSVYHPIEKTHFYMSTESGDVLWHKPVVSIYKPPRIVKSDNGSDAEFLRLHDL